MKRSLTSVFFSHDYHALIGLIYDAVNGHRGFFPFLRSFVRVFDGHSASFAIYNQAENTLVGTWTYNIPEHALLFYSEHVAHQDALVEAAKRVALAGQSRFVASNLDLGPDTERLRQESRAGEWLQSYGASEAAGAIVYSDGQYLTFFGLQRAPRQPPFTRAELALFNNFLPHVSRAVGLYVRLAQMRSGPVPEQLALERLSRGIVICDASFRVMFRNSTAQRLLNADAGLRVTSDGVLGLYSGDPARSFPVLLSTAVEASVAQREMDDQVLQVQCHGHHLVLVITPLLGGAGQQVTGAMIAIHDRDLAPEVHVPLLQAMYGLTNAEVDVAGCLLGGQSLADIAADSGRSRETVKFHLNGVFRKTGTSRQGELISLLSRSCLSS